MSDLALTAEQFFAGAPFVQASAPGRVNLLGEHTDYNDGFMLPIATPQRTTVSVGAHDEPQFHFYSATLRSGVSFGVAEEAPAGFARYVFGCIRMLEHSGVAVPPLRVHVDSNVPLGTGLSSRRKSAMQACTAA